MQPPPPFGVHLSVPSQQLLSSHCTNLFPLHSCFYIPQRGDTNGESYVLLPLPRKCLPGGLSDLLLESDVCGILIHTRTVCTVLQPILLVILPFIEDWRALCDFIFVNLSYFETL